MLRVSASASTFLGLPPHLWQALGLTLRLAAITTLLLGLVTWLMLLIAGTRPLYLVTELGVGYRLRTQDQLPSLA